MATSQSTSKRKQPLTVNAGFTMTEQAGQRGGGPSTSKRARYAKNDEDDDEDNADNLDFVEQDRKRNQQGRKGRVVTAGYDTEDSDEDDDGGEQGVGKVAGVDPDGDEDDDMFDVSDKKEEREKPTDKGKGKQSGYLSLNEIEGQEFQTGDVTGALSDESDNDEERDPELELEDDSDAEEEEVEDPVAAGERTPPMSPGGTTVLPRKPKKSKLKQKRVQDANMDPKEALFADMGYKLDGFNMKNEMESGRFDTEGNYIANAKDPHEEHDKWLQGTYNRKSIRAAREAQKKRDEEERRRAKEAEKDGLSNASEKEVLKRTVELMEKGESVLETLQRIGNEANKHRPKKAPKTNRKQSQDVHMGNGDSAYTQHSSITTFEQFTSLTSTLMTKFNRYNLYDDEYELLLREVRRSGIVSQDWDPIEERKSNLADLLDDDDEDVNEQTQFVYQWSPAYLEEMQSTSSGETFGPFPLSDLKAWKEEGYFGSAERAERIVLQRFVDGVDREGSEGWKLWSDILPGH